MSAMRNYALIAAVCLGTFMASLDISIVNVALPVIQQALHTTLSDLQWIVDAYTLCLSALILTAGSSGDRFGRKLVWMCGVGLFTLGSVLCAFAGNIHVLLTGRVIQGVGAAAVIPGALSLLTDAFCTAVQRNRAIGIWSSVSALSLVAGPVLGGMLTDMIGWSSIFWINIPLGIIALLLAGWGIRENRLPAKVALDPFGQLLSICWPGALTWGLIAAGKTGWQNLTPHLFLLSALVLFALFLWFEMRTERPLLPFYLFARPELIRLNCASFVLGFSSYTSVFFISLRLQQVQGWSAAATGWGMAPEFLAQALMSGLFSRLLSRFSIRLLMITGYGMTALALLLLSQLHYDTRYMLAACCLVLLGSGLGLAVPATGALVMQSVAAQHSGVASSVMNALRQLGMTLGIALLGSLMNMRAVSFSIHALQIHGVKQAEYIGRILILGQKQTVMHLFSGNELPSLIRMALASGFSQAMLWAGGITVLLTVWLLITHRLAI